MRRRGVSPASPVSPAPQTALLGLAELHDLSLQSQVAPLLRLLSQEAELLPDLLRARPWLEPGGMMQPALLLETLMEQEWTGFVAHIGRVGPWVYVPTVAALQELSAGYTHLVEVARQSDLSGISADSLLGRLRDDGPPQATVSGGDPQAAEQAFWSLAQNRAAQQRTAWATRRQR